MWHEFDFCEGYDFYQYFVRFVGHGHEVHLRVMVGKDDEFCSAHVSIDREDVAQARWEQLDTNKRGEVYETLPKRYAWLCDAIRDECGIIVPVEG